MTLRVRIALLLLLLPAVSCSRGKEPVALLLALATFEKSASPPVPNPARLGILVRAGDDWNYRQIEDPDSRVFHKAMLYEPREGKRGILTAGGTRAILKLWRAGQAPETIWEADFGGISSRMRDVEVADLFGDGKPALAVATHDQGVVAVLRPQAAGRYSVQELDRQPQTIVHEIEIGDVDRDGKLEIYATPSRPNLLDGTPQPGEVVRYAPARGLKREVVATLRDRHAKEILCRDVDGDGHDELYVCVEAVSGGQVEILRYDATTPADAGNLIATLPDGLCRFLTSGDVNGDGKGEMVAATHRSGIWLLTPGEDARRAWRIESVDGESSGFEHPTLLADTDGDGVDELYVANDPAREVNCYRWSRSGWQKQTLYRHPPNLSVITWNITTAPVGGLP
jgi:hypothetical protein